ncbi:hypothetical protein [Scytonema hofmannii]|uniref:hypothetical protein n=1 Tax=Scytonema hofmannii TaxID=34078 RepID=UPI0003460DCB|nr:hypothetical protein [Scytonema hofmannii]
MANFKTVSPGWKLAHLSHCSVANRPPGRKYFLPAAASIWYLAAVWKLRVALLISLTPDLRFNAIPTLSRISSLVFEVPHDYWSLVTGHWSLVTAH